MNKFLTLTILVCSTLGCASTSFIALDPSKKYPSTDNVILLTKTPDRPFEVIGVMEGIGSLNDHPLNIIKKVQKDARKVGGHAIMLIDKGNKIVPGGYVDNPFLPGSKLMLPSGDRQVVRFAVIRFK